jgi:hypothetical protein
MTLEDLGNLGDLIGGIAVVASLIYLAVQIRQGALSQRAGTSGQIAASAAELNARLGSDPETFRVFRQGLVDPEPLDGDERARFGMLLYAIFGNIESYYHLHLSGSITDDVWERWRATAAWYIALPGFKVWWQVKPTPFTASFTRFVEDELGLDRDPEPSEEFRRFVGVPDPPA